MKKMILVDGNSIMFRAYYATAYQGTDNLMKTKAGIYTNALFAFVNMFEKILAIPHDYMLVAFDTSEPTKRHLAYDEYKAGRLKMPEELAMQIPLIHEYLNHIGAKYYMKGGYEADDIIGTFSKIAEKELISVDVFSSDRDLLQLTSNETHVHLLKKGMKEVAVYTPETLMLEFGLTPKQFIDLKALMGDPSDNIKGIPGVGEKTAIKLLHTYNSLDELYVRKDELKGKIATTIIENEEAARLSKMLVTIDTDASLDLNLEDIHQKDADQHALMNFFARYELHSFVKQYEKKQTSNIPASWSYEMIDNDEAFNRIVKSKLALYFEFDDANYHKASLWGIGLSSGESHYFLSPTWALSSKAFSSYLQNTAFEKYLFDYKATLVFLKWHNQRLENVTFDLLLAAYISNAHLGKEEFKYIVANFDYEDVLYDETVYQKGAKKGLPEDESIYQKHIVSKAKAIFDLRPTLIEKLAEEDQRTLFQEVELPLSVCLADMEYQGLSVDLEELNRQKTTLMLQIETLEKDIFALAGETFNIASPKQLGDILFEKLELPFGKKTKTGYSTNVDVLNQLKNKHPIVSLILEYRHLSKLYSTYIEGISNAIFDDKKVHTIFNQALTTTGRLSSIEPNLQNIPIRTETGKQIRKIFVPEKGDVLLGADYSQIELRILAHIADVKALKEAFNDQVDIHTLTAQKVFHVDNVSSEQRRHAKAVNFGIIYGIGAWSLADDINTTPKEAQKFIDQYLNVYPEIKNYMTDIVEYAKKHTYVKTILNRRRYIPELESKAFMQRAFGERTALNAPIQGSAADIIKLAMIHLYQYLKNNHKRTKLILQVHDELILNVPKDEVEEMKTVVPKIMKDAIKLSVKLETSCDVGNTWYDI